MVAEKKFFEEQFQRQVAIGEFELNPFEQLALQHLRGGDILDLGCGLGNLAVEAARRGAVVTAIDTSATAVTRLMQTATAESLDLHAYQVDLADFVIEGEFDAVVAIGLLMFFPRDVAAQMLAEIAAAVVPGGLAIINVLVEGTTFMDMFKPGHFTLFRPGEVEERFAGWEILVARYDRLPAPGETVKAFLTLVARKPGDAGPQG